ncbi:hypothetical protein CROQUDRAFT_95384 [Cronartium quercuum f. sp. fusiforme G11]|uniref:Uncharacterized protein n=1 Tax=Cronartium quercuum f. sp. fusiforme G11 TaxID=708437 RepID=A0A9P6TB17_9BASI|nr:hypothetical protein CROQUDRAFT_95384 [Cronartium quercuum f. sp. fusiforme G11]
MGRPDSTSDNHPNVVWKRASVQCEEITLDTPNTTVRCQTCGSAMITTSKLPETVLLCSKGKHYPRHIHGRRALPDEKRDFSLAGVNRAITAVRFESGWRRSHHRLPFAAASPVYAPPCAGEIACPLNRVMRFPAATWQLHSA